MASKKKASSGTAAPRFRDFIRDVGVRAFDQLASRAAGRGKRSSGPSSEGSGAMARLGTYWSGMNQTEKQHFFDQMISAAQVIAAAAPVLITRRRSRSNAASEAREEQTEKMLEAVDESVHPTSPPKARKRRVSSRTKFAKSGGSGSGQRKKTTSA